MPKEMRTSDLALATYLHLEGHKHTSLEMLDQRAAVWVFNNSRAVQTAAELYHGGKAKVDPKMFMFKVKEVREGLYEFLDENGHESRY